MIVVENITNNITAKLNSYFETRGITKYRIYKDTGIPQANVGRYLNGTNLPKLDELDRLLSTYCDLQAHLLGNNFLNMNNKIDILKKAIEEAEKQLSIAKSELEAFSLGTSDSTSQPAQLTDGGIPVDPEKKTLLGKKAPPSEKENQRKRKDKNENTGS